MASGGEEKPLLSEKDDVHEQSKVTLTNGLNGTIFFAVILK